MPRTKKPLHKNDNSGKKANFNKLAEGAYLMGNKNQSHQVKAQKTNDLVAGTGYAISPEWSDNNISTYLNDNNEYVIAHRGTHVGGKHGKKDLLSDFGFLFGQSDKDNRFKGRADRTEAIMRGVRAEHPEAKFHLTGHSLGGATVNHTLASNPYVANTIATAETFNAAAHPFFDNGLKVDKKTKAKLDMKVTHHRTKDDVVSRGFKVKRAFGSLEEHDHQYETPKHKSLGKRLFSTFVSGAGGVGSGLAEKHNLNEKGLHAHSLDNFTDPVGE